MEPRSELNLSGRAELKTRLGIRFSSILQMPENEVAQLIFLLEKDPLFQKLYRAQEPHWKVFARQRFPSTRIASSFYDFNEEISPRHSSTPNVEAVLLKHKTLLKEIERIGQQNFESYFLYDDGEKSVSEIAQALRISEPTAKAIRELTDQVLIHSDFFQTSLASVPPSLAPELAVSYRKIASYSLQPNGEFEIAFFSPTMARGVYKIDYDRLKKLKQTGALNVPDKKAIQEIVRWLELVNARKNLIFRILRLLPDWQKDFFSSGDWDVLKPITQSRAAIELRVTPAAVCRAIQSRSVILPGGEEVPLIYFFPSRKEVLKRKMAALFQEKKDFSDRAIQTLVQTEFGISLSRRSINVYRSEIKGTGKNKKDQK